MPARKLRSPLALVVLGLLAEEPLHPYALGQRIRERAHDRLPGVRPGSLYDVIGRLRAAELIRAEEPSRPGRHPERVRYSLTEDGGTALADWEAQALAEIGGTDELLVALSFMFVLDRHRVTELLHSRAIAMAASLQADQERLAAAKADGVPSIFLSEHEFQLALRQAEHDWVTLFVDNIETGRLAWPTNPGKETPNDPNNAA